MTKPTPIRRPRPSKSEEGYILVVAIFMLALFTIALAVALPKISKEIQRDREIETMHRGKQYIRGIRMYHKKFGYPTNVDALVKPTNNIRFMRKKYADPTTGKEDWKPVRFGQNKAPMSMGFFGQPLGGTSITGIGPTITDTRLTPPNPPPDPNAPPDPNNPSPPGSSTGLNGQTFGGGPIIGFSPNSPKKSIMVYKKKDHYNEWEFVYDPNAERMMLTGSGGPTSPTTTPTTTTTTPTTTTPTTP